MAAGGCGGLSPQNPLRRCVPNSFGCGIMLLSPRSSFGSGRRLRKLASCVRTLADRRHKHNSESFKYFIHTHCILDVNNCGLQRVKGATLQLQWRWDAWGQWNNEVLKRPCPPLLVPLWMAMAYIYGSKRCWQGRIWHLLEKYQNIASLVQKLVC